MANSNKINLNVINIVGGEFVNENSSLESLLLERKKAILSGNLNLHWICSRFSDYWMDKVSL